MSKKKQTGDSPLEELFLAEWKARYPKCMPTKEYKFHPTRQFRFDFAWPSKKLAVEIQGMGPGHCSLTGMTQDYDKHLEALLLNWKVIFLTKIHLSTNRSQETMTKIGSLLSLPAVTGYIPIRRRRNL